MVQSFQQTEEEKTYLYPLVHEGINLQSIFTYLSKSLEVLFVLEGIKPTARFPLHEYDVQKASMFCAAHNLSLVTSDFKILKFVPPDKGYANKGHRLPITSPMVGDVFVYIARSPELAQDIKTADFLDDHAVVGKLLGYPSCCIDFFVQNKEKIKDDDDYVRLALEHSSIRHAELNVLARYFDVGLISHFPCSFDCNESLQLALRCAKAVKGRSYGLGEYILNVLRKPVIFTEQDGIHLLFHDQQEGDFLRFDAVESTVTNSFHHQLAQAKIINKDYDKLILFS